MRVFVALVVACISLSLSSCSRPRQAGYSEPVRSKSVRPQSQLRVQKFTEAGAGKTLPKTSRTSSKRSKKLKTHVAKPGRPQIEAATSADKESHLPPRRPDPDIKAPAYDMESPPPLPPRKPGRNIRESHPTLVNTLSSPPESSWPLSKRQRAREFSRLRAKIFAA